MGSQVVPPVITNVMSEHDAAPAFTNSISQGWLSLCESLTLSSYMDIGQRYSQKYT